MHCWPGWLVLRRQHIPLKLRPHGIVENTNGLLRQYFPKGTDLSVHSSRRLIEVAAELNARPRKTLGMKTPADMMQQLLFGPLAPIVATTV